MKQIAVFLLSMFYTGAGFGQTGLPYSEQDLNRFTDSLIQINRYSPLESAASHGSMGLGFGLGAQSTEMGGGAYLQNRVVNSNTDQNSSESDSFLTMPKIYFIKGTAWPLDFGISFGKVPDLDLTQISAHAQWTAFEVFRLPSVAFRGSYSRLTGLDGNGEVNSSALDVLLSYGFKNVTLYGAYGVQYSQVNFSILPTEQDFFLYADVSSETVSKSITTQTQLVGLKFVFIPPFVYVDAEYQTDQNRQQSYAAKLSVGL